MINMAVAVNLVPVTGQPLPMVVYGWNVNLVHLPCCWHYFKCERWRRIIGRKKNLIAHSPMSLRILVMRRPERTGGHIFPAIAIANTIKELAAAIRNFNSLAPSEKWKWKRLPAAGYDIIGLNITGIQRSLSFSNLMFPIKLLVSLIKARSIIKSFRPDVVVGVGGYASGPVLRMATWMAVPTLIQEQNSFAGITNRWVAGSVSKACVAYDGMEKFFPADKIIKTGNPVRQNVVQIEGKREAALKEYGFVKDKPVLLIVGGSLGARSINLALEQHVGQLLDNGVQVLWQTGKTFCIGIGCVEEKIY